MPSPSINAEIRNYKTQLDEFLSKKFVDQSLLLGFTAVVQGKFLTWINLEANEYHKKLHSFGSQDQPASQRVVDFDLIELFESLWGLFYHPIIKFFLRQHADLYTQLIDSLSASKKGKKGANFKAVEMRKLNETFSRFVKGAFSFYRNELEYLLSNYSNTLFPSSIFDELELNLDTSKAVASLSIDFKTNHSYMLYYCLLGMGNLSRHSTVIKMSYVKPCKSISAYYKHLKQQKSGEVQLATNYSHALLFYSKCIALLPALNEPYNHIGVIYNNLNRKGEAVMWFMRSQFTRIPNYTVGKVNMITVFEKPWLEDAYAVASQCPPAKLTKDHVQNILLRVFANFFFWRSYKKPFLCERAQAELLGILFSNPATTGFVKDVAFIQQQLVLLICFYCWADVEKLQTAKKSVALFFVAYLNSYVRDLSDLSETRLQHLPNIRLILAFIRKNPLFLNYDKGDLYHNWRKAINALISQDESMEFKDIMGDAFTSEEAPSRTHFFDEDVQFKDFGPIGFQFKDFRDDHLFRADDSTLLFGSKYYKGMPAFLDNAAVQRINKDMELLNGTGELTRAQAVAEETEQYENKLRLSAVASQIHRSFPALYFDTDTGSIELDVEVATTQKNQSKKKIAKGKPKILKHFNEETPWRTLAQIEKDKKSLEKTGAKPKIQLKKPEKKASQESQDGEQGKGELQVANLSVEISNSTAAPSSLEEIELMIAGHARHFGNRVNGREMDVDAGLTDMVNSIVSDTEHDKPNDHDIVSASTQKSHSSQHSQSEQPGFQSMQEKPQLFSPQPYMESRMGGLSPWPSQAPPVFGQMQPTTPVRASMTPLFPQQQMQHPMSHSQPLAHGQMPGNFMAMMQPPPVSAPAGPPGAPGTPSFQGMAPMYPYPQPMYPMPPPQGPWAPMPEPMPWNYQNGFFLGPMDGSKQQGH